MTNLLSQGKRKAQGRAAGVQPRVVAEISGVQFVVAAVRAGIGVAIFTLVPLAPDDGVAFLSLGREDIPRQQVAAITRSFFTATKPSRHFFSSHGKPIVKSLFKISGWAGLAGIFPPCKAKKRRNTCCITSFFNAAGRKETCQRRAGRF